MLQSFQIHNRQLNQLPNRAKLLITTINAYCYNLTHIDAVYYQALLSSDVLIPDGISVVWAIRWLTGQKLQKIAGADLFFYELKRLQQTGGKCFFLGSTMTTLNQIKEKINLEYPRIKVETYSPPYKPVFSEDDNSAMLIRINAFIPDVLMIGMTAPKQEKWAYEHFNQLQVGHICCIGAVFDFYAGIINRAPKWMINLGLEWLYRLVKEPRRMWRRYLIGNLMFIVYVIKEKIKQKKPRGTNPGESYRIEPN
ncbi:MAG TPA: beta-1,4-N-acetyl- mannosaminyltransferase [Prolixibacteraceae bacterium]|nr:beta-1,4-N-acetyl- mannosaminyltransferase [Prolixibacteraceae bacterium]